MKRSIVRELARCLVCVLFLAQLTVAAYACPAVASAMAVSASQGLTADAATASMPNCSEMAGALDPDAPNLCAEHCKYGQQSDHASTLTVPAVILHALYTTPAVPPTPLPQCTAALMGAPVAASPPHAILHCVFRI